MGSKAMKIIVYPLLFVVTFALSLYFMFPYETLKDRIIGVIEQQMGEGLEVSIESLEPYWFTGVEVVGLVIKEAGQGKEEALINLRRAHARASLFSLLTGRQHFSFYVEMGEGEVEGTFNQSDEFLEISAYLDDFDISQIKLISTLIGLKLSSKIGGDVVLRIDRQNPAQSTGKITLDLEDVKIAASEAKLGEMNLPLPDLTVAGGRESKIRLQIDKGTMMVDSFRFANGDLNTDIKGKAFLSNKIENYRLNLSGSFTPSKKLGDALPFLFIVEQQKQADGSYPISITGRLVQPTFKIGTFTVPM